jgi:hypothetical protein
MHALITILHWLAISAFTYSAGLFALLVIALFSSKEEVVSDIFKYGPLYPLFLIALPFVLLIELVVEGGKKVGSFVANKFYDVKYAIRNWRVARRNRRAA